MGVYQRRVVAGEVRPQRKRVS